VLHVSATQGHLQAVHFFKESTALCTLSIVLLKDVIIINFGVIGCLFFLSFVLRPLCAPLGVLVSWSCVFCVDTYDQESVTPSGAQSSCNTKDRKNRHPITPKLIIMTYFKSTIDSADSAVDSLKKCVA
jgi:hypothetical protein